MEIEEVKEQFNSCTDIYDSGRRFFIPCFDDYYEIGVNLLSEMHNDFKSILDLGAGTGLLSKYLYEKFPLAEFLLVDIAEKMLDVAKIRFNGLQNISFKVQDYSKKLPDGDFDLISSALSIHHLDEQEKRSLYSAVYDRLPKGGCFINLDQFNAGSDEINNAFNNYWYDCIQQSGITEDELNRWLQRKDLDKENTIRETLLMLDEIGFKDAECIYQYLKFGVIVAIK